MGGIPWQSQGCQTCKQRKIKCDLQRPKCARCIKRGVACPGYVEGRMFIHHQSAQPIEKSGRLQNSPQTTQLQPFSRDRVTFLSQFIRDGPHIRTQLSSALFHAYAPLDPTRTTGVDTWLYLLSNFLALTTKSEMLERAISALSCIYAGKVGHDHHLVRYGVQQYNLSIRLMHGMLHRNIRSPDVLYATVIFQVLEGIHCPHGLLGWIAHLDGMNAILRYFRPAAPVNALVKTIYETQQKVHFMFSATATKSVGGACHPPIYSFEEGPLDELFNFFVNIVSTQEHFEKFDHSDYEACQSALETCLAHKKAMILWYNQTVDCIGGRPSACAPGTILCDKLPPTDGLFGPAYSFSSLDNATMHLLHWTGMILIQSLIFQAASLVRFHGKVTNADPTTDEEFTLTGLYADQICRAMSYCLQPKMRLGGAHSTVACLNHVYKTYVHRRCREQYLWCQSTYLHVASLGFESSRHIYESSFKYWEISEDPHVNMLLSLSLRLTVPLSWAGFMGQSNDQDLDSERTIAVP